MYSSRLLENLGGEASDHQIVSLVKYDRYDIRQDFLVKLQKVNLADIRDIVEIKSVVMVATIKVIKRDNKWYYLACGSCNGIVDEKTVDKKDNDFGELKKQVVFVCSNKEYGKVTNVRYKVASKFLNRTAEEFIREMRKYVYPVATFTDDGSIIEELEAIESTEQRSMSGPREPSSFGYAEDSNDTLPLKRSVEVIDVEDISDLLFDFGICCYAELDLNSLLLGRPPLNDISEDIQVLPKRRGRPPLNDISEYALVLPKRRATTSTTLPQNYASQEYLDHGDPTVTCGACGAVLLTMMEYMDYLIQERPNQFSLIHHARRLFQQFLVDIFTMIENEMLYLHRSKQKVLRCESYQNLANHIDKEDRPDMLCKLFKIKLDHLVKSLKENKIFRKVEAAVYTIEFQKHRLPHSHICIFMYLDDKIRNNERIDDFISAEIPDEEADPQLYKFMSDHMMHGPYEPDNPSCPCTIQGKCTKRFPKKYSERTSTDSDGYPVYKRRDDGQQHVVNEADTDITDAIDKPSVASLKFLGWMECNKTNDLEKL
uniref:Helitron helicase-like domain-containing protein n=1 Tax=Tanacetum cinerariifolium TaxID=118510 RepID=A0A699GVJ3_TANCI|nr:hypothetical protein [Tanacetum cinerariifolium]